MLFCVCTEELAAGQKALGLANAARQEAEARVSELKQEVTTAMALLEQVSDAHRLTWCVSYAVEQ